MAPAAASCRNPSTSSQARNPADINPGTLQPGAIRLLAGPLARPYQFRALRGAGLWVAAPGAIEVEADAPGEAAFSVHPWSAGPSFVVDPGAEVSGEVVGRLDRSRTIRIDGGGKPAGLRIRVPK